MKFIDLFAGLGGFHKALHELGHECVFASELIPALKEIYKLNWGKDINIQGDIKKIVAADINSIPDHDILCAGFPCQPFSKAGKQLGRQDEYGFVFGVVGGMAALAFLALCKVGFVSGFVCLAMC